MKNILVGLFVAVCTVVCGHIECSGLHGMEPQSETATFETQATVAVTVTTADGNVYTVDEYTTEVTVDTNQSGDCRDWEVINY